MSCGQPNEQFSHSPNEAMKTQNLPKSSAPYQGISGSLLLSGSFHATHGLIFDTGRVESFSHLVMPKAGTTTQG